MLLEILSLLLSILLKSSQSLVGKEVLHGGDSFLEDLDAFFDEGDFVVSSFSFIVIFVGSSLQFSFVGGNSFEDLLILVFALLPDVLGGFQIDFELLQVFGLSFLVSGKFGKFVFGLVEPVGKIDGSSDFVGFEVGHGFSEMLLKGIQETNDSFNSGSTNNVSVISARFELLKLEGFFFVVFVASSDVYYN